MKYSDSIQSERIVAPAALPVSLAEAKDHLSITGTDSDTYLERLIGSAVRFIDGDGLLGRAMINQTWRDTIEDARFFDADGRYPLRMARATSIVSVSHINLAGAEITVTSDFELLDAGPDLQMVAPLEGSDWPADLYDRPDAIRISYVCGYGADSTFVPEDLKLAILMLVEQWFEHRGAAGAVALVSAPMGFPDLIGRHRRRWGFA